MLIEKCPFSIKVEGDLAVEVHSRPTKVEVWLQVALTMEIAATGFKSETT
jgi:hypothetical protein